MTKTDLLVRVLASLRTRVAVMMYALLGVAIHHSGVEDTAAGEFINKACESLHEAITNLESAIADVQSGEDYQRGVQVVTDRPK